MSYWGSIRIAGEEVEMMVHPAGSGGFEVGARYGNTDEDGYVALLENEELCWHRRVSDPRSVGVSDIGDVVVADWIEYGESTGADIFVIDKTNSRVCKFHLDASAPVVDISPDSNLIAVCPYSEPARIIDIPTNQELLRHEYDLADRLIPQWVRVDGEVQLEFRQKSGTDPLYRINVDGNITWTGDSFESHQYYQIVTLDETAQWEDVLEKFVQDYIQSDDPELKDIIANTIGDARLVDANREKLQEIVDALTAVRATFTNNDAHEKLIAQILGEAYYRLADDLRGGVSIDDRFWQLIEQSAVAYQTALPWYEGKRGLAKTLRLQANQYAKQNRTGEAFCCYEQIESLESQYDVNLLSTGDKNRLEEYREKNLKSKKPQETGRLIQPDYQRMSTNSPMDLDLETEYILGILDYLARPKLKPYESPGEHTSGYGLNPKVSITVRQSGLLLGAITSFFDNNNINCQFKRRNSDGIPTRIVVSEIDSIINLNKLGQGTFIQIAERLEYLAAVCREYEGKPIAGHEERFYRIYKPWLEIDSVQEKEKYTLDFFKKKLGISSIDNQFEDSNPTYPDSLSTAYVAGAFDAAGILSLQIHEQPANKLGYGIYPIAGISIGNPDIRVKPHFVQYFKEHNLDPNLSKQNKDSKLSIRFSAIDEVESFIALVGGKTIYHYDVCELFYEQLIPAYMDQYHRTKDGFVDMLRAFEEVANDRPKAKYTTEYFEEKWF